MHLQEWLKSYSAYKCNQNGLTSNTSSQLLTGTPGLNLIRNPACSPEASPAHKSQQRWFRWEPQKMQAHTPVWGPDINVLVQIEWKTRLERLPCWNRPKLGWRPTLADLFLQASCLPAGCLLRGFVCLITSLWETQSQTMPISMSQSPSTHLRVK